MEECYASPFVMTERQTEVEGKGSPFEEPVQRPRETVVYSPSDFVDDEQALTGGKPAGTENRI